MLKPHDITKFDKLVSPHEVAALKGKKRNGNQEEEEETILQPISITPSKPPLPPQTKGMIKVTLTF